MDTELQVTVSDFNGEQVQAVSAKSLHEFLGLSKRHFASWLGDTVIGNEYAIEGEDYIIQSAGVGVKDCILTIDYAKRLSMKSGGAKAEEVRRYFVNVEKAFKRVVTPQIPQTFAQALLLASKQAEEIEALEEMRAINAPLVEFAKTVQSVENEITVEEFAKVTFPKFNLGRNLMFAKLRELGFLKGDNIPYQQYITQGLFRTIDVIKGNRVYVQTLITGKGQVLLEGEIV